MYVYKGGEVGGGVAHVYTGAQDTELAAAMQQCYPDVCIQGWRGGGGAHVYTGAQDTDLVATM